MPSIWLVENILIPRIPRLVLLLSLLIVVSLGLSRGLFRSLNRNHNLPLNQSPHSSPSYQAERVLLHYFPQLALMEEYSTQVLISSLQHDVDVLKDPRVRAFEQSFESLLFAKFSNLYYSSARTHQSNSYFAHSLVNNADFPTTQMIHLSLLQHSAPVNHSAISFEDFIDQTIDLLRLVHLPNREEFFVGSTGPRVFSRDLSKASERDVLFIDLTTFPLAMLLLAVIFRSFRLLILPLCCIVSVVAISTLFVSLVPVHYTSLVPSLMSASTVGLSIDSSLFLLSRFREELKRGSSVTASITQSVLFAGHTICVSGITLSFCWFVLVIFPIELMRSVGIALGISSLVCVFVNTLLMPSLILCFPLFFSNEDSFFSLESLKLARQRLGRRLRRCCRLCCFYVCYRRGRRSSSNTNTGGLERHNSTTPPIDPVYSSYVDDSFSLVATEAPLLLNSSPLTLLPLFNIDSDFHIHSELKYLEANSKRTFQVAKFVTRSKRTAAFIVLVLSVSLLPFVYFAYQYSRSNAMQLMIPRHASGTLALLELERSFGKGRQFPYRLLLVQEPTEDFKSLFSRAQEMSTWLMQNNRSMHIHDVSSCVFFNHQPVSLSQFNKCINSKVNNNEYCSTVVALVKESLSVHFDAVAIKVELSVDPNSSEGVKFLQLVRDLDTPNLHVALGASVSLDVIEAVYATFPLAVTLTCLLVLIFIALAFRSLVVPLRALFSIFSTLCFSYGSAVLVYQYGALEFLNISGLQSPTREIYWVSPIMLFGVLCGISLDYDTFCLTRILEYKMVGFSESDAVRAGLASSFKVVTMAGLIMTMAFSGLLFSQVPVLNQVSFFLVTSVLFDTIVVRTLYVPSLMILFGKYNWFPSHHMAKWRLNNSDNSVQ